MNINHKEQDSKGSFFVGEEKHKKAEMTYSWAGDDRIIIDHTEVDDSLRGQGVGKKLVKAAVEFARKKNISIIPLCPFAKATFDKNPDLKDVL